MILDFRGKSEVPEFKRFSWKREPTNCEYSCRSWHQRVLFIVEKSRTNRSGSYEFRLKTAHRSRMMDTYLGATTTI